MIEQAKRSRLRLSPSVALALAITLSLSLTPFFLFLSLVLLHTLADVFVSIFGARCVRYLEQIVSFVEILYDFCR